MNKNCKKYFFSFNKAILAFCISSIILFFVTNKAYAQFTGGVMVYPNVVELNFGNGSNFASSIIQVENPTDSILRVRAYIEDWTLNQYGKIVFLDKPDKRYLGSYVKFNPVEFDLAPKQKQMVRVAAKVPEGPEGEYRSIVYFETVNPKQEVLKQTKDKLNINISFKTRYGVALYGYKGDISRSAVMQDLKFEKIDNSNYITATLKNSGNIHCNLEGDLVLTPESGTKSLTIPLIRYTILPDSTQKYAIQLPEDLNNGAYKAAINLNYHDIESKVQVLDAQTKFNYISTNSSAKKGLKNSSGEEKIDKTPENLARPIMMNK